MTKRKLFYLEESPIIRTSVEDYLRHSLGQWLDIVAEPLSKTPEGKTEERLRQVNPNVVIISMTGSSGPEVVDRSYEFIRASIEMGNRTIADNSHGEIDWGRARGTGLRIMQTYYLADQRDFESLLVGPLDLFH